MRSSNFNFSLNFNLTSTSNFNFNLNFNLTSIPIQASTSNFNFSLNFNLTSIPIQASTSNCNFNFQVQFQFKLQLQIVISIFKSKLQIMIHKIQDPYEEPQKIATFYFLTFGKSKSKNACYSLTIFFISKNEFFLVKVSIIRNCIVTITIVSIFRLF